jgi:hypothetical protein
MILRDGPSVSRNPSAPQVFVVIAALVVGGIGLVALRSGEPGSDSIEHTAAEISVDGVKPIGVRLAREGAATHLTLPPPATGELPQSTTIATAPETAPSMQSAPATTAAPQPQATDGRKEHDHGYEVHNFVDHVAGGLGAQMLAPDQGAYGDYERVGPNQIQARAPITGLRPVIEQAITDVKERDRSLTGEDLERRIAQRLTELNDWENLTPPTRAKMMILSGLDIESMGKREREDRVNHMLHSPQPFGDLAEVISPDVTIDLGYTHTLDKEWTKVADLGNGVFQIWMVSNNDNGSHTGHSLGSFKVQLPPGTTVDQAREAGNRMVVNKNNNEKLYLDLAAKHILYGQTPLLDFSQKPPPTTTSTTAPATTSTTVEITTTTTGQMTTSTTSPESTSTRPNETTSSTASSSTTTS